MTAHRALKAITITAMIFAPLVGVVVVPLAAADAVCSYPRPPESFSVVVFLLGGAIPFLAVRFLFFRPPPRSVPRLPSVLGVVSSTLILLLFVSATLAVLTNLTGYFVSAQWGRIAGCRVPHPESTYEGRGLIVRAAEFKAIKKAWQEEDADQQKEAASPWAYLPTRPIAWRTLARVTHAEQGTAVEEMLGVSGAENRTPANLLESGQHNSLLGFAEHHDFIDTAQLASRANAYLAAVDQTSRLISTLVSVVLFLLALGLSWYNSRQLWIPNETPATQEKPVVPTTNPPPA